MVYTASTYANDAAASTVDGTGLHPAYFPRIGEYYQNSIYHNYYSSSTNGKLYPMLTDGFSDTGNVWSNFMQVQNSSIQMDMDYLMHDIGFSADKNTQVDMWEFLDQTITHIPVLPPQAAASADRTTRCWTRIHRLQRICRR